MKRVTIKIGDIFSVKLDNAQKKYFQYIGNDINQLSSNVIRAFSHSYHIDSLPTMQEIIEGDVEFYAHCIIRWGIKFDLWEKVGKIPDVGDINKIIFRNSRDYGRKEPVKISTNWYVWSLDSRSTLHVGKLEDENRNAEIGVVISPKQIVQRIQTGKYSFSYPGFE